MLRYLYRLVFGDAEAWSGAAPKRALACDHSVPVIPLIPAHSHSESRNHFDFLRVRPGFEPEGRGFDPSARSARASRAAKPHEHSSLRKSSTIPVTSTRSFTRAIDAI